MSSTKLYLIDAGSTDRTLESALTFSQWLDITIIPPGPEPVSRNAVARVALTRYLLFLDPEIEIYDPTLIRRTVETAKQQGLHCATTNVSSPAVTSWDRLLYLENNAMQKLSRIHRPFSGSSFLLFDRAAFDALGGFDEKGRLAEDYSLSRKVRRGKFAVIPGKVVTTNQRLRQLGHVGLLLLFLHRGMVSPRVRAARVSS